MKKLLLAAAIVAFLGVLVSAYSLSHHYGAVSGGVCNINETFSCDVVNQSKYSEVFGIPVALLGIVGYVLMGISALIFRSNPNDKTTKLFLILSVLGGLAFSLYLTGIEAFVLYAFCPTCLVSQGLMLIVFILTIIGLTRKSYDGEPSV